MARMEKDYELFDKVLQKVDDGMTITFTKDNIADGDDFLILGCGYDSCTIIFKSLGDMWYVLFDNDEPMLLEDVPVSFLRSILKNIK